MPLDTRIALGAQPLQLESPLAQYGQAVGIQNAAQQNQLGQMQMSAAQRAMQEEEGLKNYLTDPKTDLTTAQGVQGAMRFGAKGLAYAKAIAEQKKAGLEGDKLAAEILGANQKNFTALNSPMDAAARGPAGVTDYVEAMYKDPVLGPLALRVKSREQALAENQLLFQKDPQQWVMAHANLDGQHLLDALKTSQENADERARIASRMPSAAAPVASPAAPVAPPAVAVGVTKEISPGVRVNSNLSPEDVARIAALGDKGSMSYPGERWTLSPTGNLISEPIPGATATNAMAPVNVNAMNPNAATMQAINAERTRLEADRNRLLNLRQSKGVQDELKSVEAQLKEINAPINLRAEGIAFIPGRGTLTAAPTMTETQKEYAIIADPNASKGAKDAATARIAHLTNIPEKAVPALIQEYEYAQKNNGYKGSLADFKVLSTPKTTVQTNVNAYTPASEEAQRDFIRSTRTTYDTLKNAPGTLKNIEEAIKLIPSAKGFMGPGGESLLDAASFLNNRLGTNINTKGITDATELRSRLFQGIIENLRKLDANPTENQQNAMRVALGNIGTDPNALPAVLNSFADTVRSKVETHNAEVEGAVSRGVKFPYDPTIKLPTFTPPAPSGAALIPTGKPAATGEWKVVK